MDTNSALRVGLQDAIRSNINESYMADYGVVKAVYSTGGVVTTIDVVHYAPAWTSTNGMQPNITKNVEVLYTATAGLSVEVPLAVGDSVLLVGSRRYVKTVGNVTTANCPSDPGVSVGYDKATLKAIPVGILNASSQVYLRFKNGKAQLKSATASLYTALDNFEAAVQTFSSVASQNAITAGGASSTLLAGAIVTLLIAMNASVTSAKASLAQILEA